MYLKKVEKAYSVQVSGFCASLLSTITFFGKMKTAVVVKHIGTHAEDLENVNKLVFFS